MKISRGRWSSPGNLHRARDSLSQLLPGLLVGSEVAPSQRVNGATAGHSWSLTRGKVTVWDTRKEQLQIVIYGTFRGGMKNGEKEGPRWFWRAINVGK